MFLRNVGSYIPSCMGMTIIFIVTAVKSILTSIFMRVHIGLTHYLTHLPKYITFHVKHLQVSSFSSFFCRRY
jgi:hypothetical protein